MNATITKTLTLTRTNRALFVDVQNIDKVIHHKKVNRGLFILPTTITVTEIKAQINL